MESFVAVFIVVTAFQAFIVGVPIAMSRAVRSRDAARVARVEARAPWFFAAALPITIGATLGAMGARATLGPAGAGAVRAGAPLVMCASPLLAIAGFVAGTAIVRAAREQRARAIMDPRTFD